MCIGWVDSLVVGHGQGFVFCQIIVLLAALKGRTARHKSQGALGCCYMRGAWVQVLQFGTLQGSNTISPQTGGTRKIIDSNTCWRLWGIWTVSSLEGMYFLANLVVHKTSSRLAFLATFLGAFFELDLRAEVFQPRQSSGDLD